MEPTRRTVDSLSPADDNDDGAALTSSVATLLLVLVLVGAAVASFMRYRRVDTAESAESEDDDKPKESGGGSGVTHSGIVLKNPNMHPNHSFCKQWQLPEDDRGAVTFSACAPSGGLVVYLSTSPDNATLSDSRGYAIVLDDQGDPPRSYIGELPHFEMVDNRNSTSRINKGFRLNASENSCQLYWVLYDHGNILVGEGAYAPGSEATLIVCRNDSMNDPPMGVRYFGFGTLRRETDGITISRIATYDVPTDEVRLRAPLQCSSAVALTML